VNNTVSATVLFLALAATSAICEQTMPQPSDSPTLRSRADTSTTRVRSPYRRQDTWYEFMLKQFNPNNVDYGNWIEQRRHAFIERRLKNSYFLYSLWVTLALVFATTGCLKQWIDHRRAMRVTADMMADLYNQDAYSRQVAQEAIERYNKHIERCNRAIEAGENSLARAGAGNEIEQLRAELMKLAEERDTAIRDRDIAREDLRRKSDILANMSLQLETLTNKTGEPNSAKSTFDLRGADPKLVTHINDLQERLYAERKNNRRLREG
jgi:hypothetical protein